MSRSRIASATPSSRSSRSRCLSSISLAIALALAPGCGDDADCGIGTAPLDGITLTLGAQTFTYTELTSLPGNDCPDLSDPDAPTSVTIEGREVGGAGTLTFCIPRPDRIGDGARSIGTPSVAGDVQIVDVPAVADGCSHTLVYESDPPGTATATGACDNLTNPAGFALTVDTTVMLERACPAMEPALVSGTLAGTAAVLLRPGS